jgi:hypothetical protein
MADTKISALPASTTPLAGTEVLPIVQGGVTKQVSVANLTDGRAISATQLTLTTGNLIVASGQGIDFSATSGTGTSELLSDYEEGTWTPIISDGSNNATMSAGSSGLYTRIGRQITLIANISPTSMTGVTGNLQIKGLPFAVANNEASRGSMVCTFAGGLNVAAAGRTIMGIPGANSSVIFLQMWDATTGTSDVAAAEVPASSFIYVAATYFV